MKIAVGSDHAGLSLKSKIAAALGDSGHEVEDLGTRTPDSCDYPDFAHAVARKVASGGADRGVLVCGSGIGMSMAANRHAGVRAAVVSTVEAARLARAHNDANVICLGERLVPEAEALEIVREFLETAFDGGRHARRIAKIEPAGK